MSRSTSIKVADFFGGICVAGFALLATMAQAAPQQSAVRAAAGAAEIASTVALRMSYAEVVNIRVPEYRILSGEYRIGADGTVALPGIGRLDVSKLSISEFEGQLRGAIYQLSNREAKVAVEISLYRSVYVSGAVSRAGAFPWKPGFSVLHAQALAGGIARPRSEAVPPAMNLTQPNAGPVGERTGRAVLDLSVALATIERLKTEKKRGTVFVMPERVSQLIGEAEVQRLAARQQALLDSRKAALETRIRALQNARTLAVTEKNALEMQRVRIKEQLTSRKAMRERIKRMARQGFSRADRVFEEQVRIAMLEERMTTTSLGISRMAMAEVTAKQDLESLYRAREAEIDVELLDLEQRVGGLEIQLTNSNPALASTAVTRAGNASGTSAAVVRQPRYEIVRVVDGKTVVLPADRTTALQPGDVLVVSSVS